MPKPPSLYTGRGDQGYTSLGNHTISKDETLLEALGTIDELNSHIGLVSALSLTHLSVHHTLIQIQNHLLDMGSELHQPSMIRITASEVTWLEQHIDAWQAALPPLKEFILPGGTPLAASLHIARAVCRRAERALVRYHRQSALNNSEQLRYLNRLSDFLFAAARMLAHVDHAEEKHWKKG